MSRVLCFERVADDLTSASDAFFVGVGIHPEGHRCVAMAEPLRYADDIGSRCDHDACGAVSELVGVEVLDLIISFYPH